MTATAISPPANANGHEWLPFAPRGRRACGVRRSAAACWLCSCRAFWPSLSPGYYSRWSPCSWRAVSFEDMEARHRCDSRSWPYQPHHLILNICCEQCGYCCIYLADQAGNYAFRNMASKPAPHIVQVDLRGAGWRPPFTATDQYSRLPSKVTRLLRSALH
jgi:hypothetical protein